jgi:hypothetical protein
MTKRNSPNEIKSLADLSRLDEIVVDKRLGKRANEKRKRRNRHYGKQFIKNTLTGGVGLDSGDDVQATEDAEQTDARTE